jgi:hypothetical protein
MAMSDQLLRLSQRTKQAEDRVAAANTQARQQLERDVEQARQGVQETVDQLSADTATASSGLDAAGRDIRQSWSEHLAQVRSRIDARKAHHDAKVAEDNAEDAEDYAVFAINFAYSTVEEAEYAALDAVLAREEADTAAGAATR